MSDDAFSGLPVHFRREAEVLRGAGVRGWRAVAELDGHRIRTLARTGGASEARLLRLRAQARLMEAVDLPAAEASLLLHAGIADVRALAAADPARLAVQVERLRRRLLGTATPPLAPATLQAWIRRARGESSGSGRSPN